MTSDTPAISWLAKHWSPIAALFAVAVVAGQMHGAIEANAEDAKDNKQRIEKVVDALSEQGKATSREVAAIKSELAAAKGDRKLILELLRRVEAKQ
jgi:excinuclease UvrABC ATPase subunit